MSALIPHAIVLGLWAGATILLVGAGTLFFAASGRSLVSWRDLSTAFWLGLAAATLLLQSWHFFAPVNVLALLALSLLSTAGWIRSAHTLIPLVRRRPQLSRRTVVGLALVVIWIANRALGPTESYDTGMYHQQVLNWSTSFPLVPGLGNLHGRLAFNSSALLVGSLFDVGPLHQMAIHTFNALLYVVLAVEGLVALSVVRTGSVRAFHLFSIAILPVILFGVVGQEVRSLSTDAAVAAALLVATRLLFDALAHRPPERRDRAFAASALITLFATAACMKLSAAVFAVTGSLVALTLLRREGAGDAPLRPAHFALVVAPAFLLGITWMARGAVLSGHPLYPSALLALPVDWRVAAEQAAGESAWVGMSARNLNTNVTYAGLSWIGPWLRGIVVRGDLFAQFTLPVLLLGAIGLARWRMGHRSGANQWTRGWGLVWLPIVGSAVFWLLAAPHPRLGSAFAWSALAVAASALVTPAHRPGSGRRRALFGVAALALTALLLAKQAAGAAWRARDAGPWSAAAHALVTLPQDGRWIAALPEAAVDMYHTNSGLPLLVPVEDNRCFDAPLPCTPHPTPFLVLRGSSLAEGFRTSGSEWAPERWPNPFTSFLGFWRCSREGSGARAAREARCLTAPPGVAR